MSRGAGGMLCALIAAELAGCGGAADSSMHTADRPAAHSPPIPAERRPVVTGHVSESAPPQRPAVRVGRWRIGLRVRAPRSSGGITFAAGQLHAVGRHGVEHELVITNTRRRPVTFADTRSSRLLGAGGRREPLAGDEGCGYAQSAPGAAIEPNACRRNLDAFTVPGGRTVTRTITLSWDLPGAGRLTPGTYVFRRPVRFVAGRRAPAGGSGHAMLVRLVYSVSG